MKPTSGLSRKIFLKMNPPSEEDSRSSQTRILDALRTAGVSASFSAAALRQLYPLCDNAGWRVTASLGWNGTIWEILMLEAGDTEKSHYGLAVDLGSTSVYMRLLNCSTGETIEEVSEYNRQIAFGEDILTRIFYAKDNPEHLDEIRKATIRTLTELMSALRKKTGIAPSEYLSMVVSGNMTMIHFLIGLDPFCIFQTPYAVRSDAPGFLRGSDLDLPITGYVYCIPGKANYLGGDITSGILATGIYKGENISLFFDVGTNGELAVGNSSFLLCGAGAAGPALEGGVVHTGMRAAPGAVESVSLADGEFHLKTIGGEAPAGICGSGIVDLLSELFLNGWINLQGVLQPEKSSLISIRKNPDTGMEEAAVCYAPGLYFYQNDIREFISTKAAAATMIEYMLQASGIRLEDIDRFYMAGAFGAHIHKESAIDIGMYPDVERDRICPVGNTSLEGASMLLLNRELLTDIDRILDLMSYVQFGAVDNFVEMMQAASALPHTDGRRYPSVMKKLQDRAARSETQSAVSCADSRD
ncbi:MAG: ASKHA domain-containing protein [Bilifractor sp.]|jgi:uncharacterized 2Fe-2S/4Fe-4S cluster protein (DUF4445 family)